MAMKRATTRPASLAAITMLTFALLACSDAGEAPPMTIVGSTWKLMSVLSDSGTTAVPLGQVYTIAFVSDTLASGQIHCNTYSVSYRLLQTGLISFGPFAATKIYCPQPSLEADFRSAFKNPEILEFDRNYLRLRYAEQTKVMSFYRIQ